MKKFFLIVFSALCFCAVAQAVPAYRGLISYTQPDGSVIQIRLHGDEFCHWVTDASGKVLEMDADGYYRPASEAQVRARRASATIRRAAVNAKRLAPAKTGIASGTDKRFLVVLVSFSDIDFKISNTQQAFSNLMNQNGYSANGGTGSVRDFYNDNSHGYFVPNFDVAGPYKVSKTASYYAGSSGFDYAEEAFYEACQKANNDVDFSNYDLDGDGVVDMVFFYYAGYNQAEGKANTIWPHQYTFQATDYYNVKFDGKKLGSYACTSELKGTSGTNMCGIGTACHEFGHAMGLPDFYDTDYDDYNGEAGGLYDYSTMCGGSYNNSGRTPPYFNIEERILLGWQQPSIIQEFGESGTYTLTSVSNDVAYKTPTDMDGEYFVYECRSKTGWDRYIPEAGLIVYHVDKSSRTVPIYHLNNAGTEYVPDDTITASSLWSNWTQYNCINENGSHPCFYVVPAGEQSNLYYTGSQWAFTGATGRNSFTARSWNGVDSDVQLSNIAYSDNQVTLYATVPSTVLNYNVIANPCNGSYSAGSYFTPELEVSQAQPVSSVQWYIDDEPIGEVITTSPFQGPSVRLSAGQHLIEAHLSLSDGSTKILELSVTAN